MQMGMAMEPGGLEHQLVTASAGGELAFIDFRAVSSSSSYAAEGSLPPAQMGKWKSVDASTKGGLSALAAHRHAPILATGTTSQVCVQTLKHFSKIVDILVVSF